MKKSLYFGLVSLLALSIFFGGCASNGEITTDTKVDDSSVVESIFNQEDLEAFVKREPDFSMSYAGPFYFGSYDGVNPRSKEYSEQRRENVYELLEVLDSGIGFLENLDGHLKKEKEIFTWYVGEIQKIDNTTAGYTNDLLNATDLALLSESLANLNNLKNTVSNMELSPEWGYGQFQKYVNLVELTNLYSVEAGSLVNRTLALYYLLEVDLNPAYKKLNKDFMAKIDPVSNSISAELNKLYHTSAVLNYGEDLLFASDYYFSREQLLALDEEISKIDKVISEYEGTNELLSENMVSLLKKKAQDIKDYRLNIVNYLDSIPASELLSEDALAFVRGEKFAFLPVAYAEGPPPSFGSPGWFQEKISTTIKVVKAVPGFTKAVVKMAGEKCKDLYDKSGAHEVVKDGAQIVNGGIEILNSAVEVSIHGAQGLYFGDMSWADFKKKLEDEKEELHGRFVAGTLGKDQYDEMIRQMDQFKANTDKFVENMSNFSGDMTGIISGSPKIGDFIKRVSQNVGNEIKSPLDTATEFSKNLAIVMHPNTSKEDTRNALLNIYSALQGAKDEDGKYIKLEIPNLSELIKGKSMEEIQKELKGLGLSQEEEKEFIDELKEIFDKELRGAETKESGKKDTKGSKKNDAVTEILTNPNLSEKEIRDLILGEIMRDLPPIGTKSKEKKDEKKEVDKDTDKDGVENIYDNCENISNPEQNDSDFDGTGDACDEDCSGDKDRDESCDEWDNCPDVYNPDQLDADNDGQGNMCDDDPPPIDEIAGVWPGTITVTETYFTPEFREEADENGCDIETIEESKDVAKPVSIEVIPSSENGGSIVIGGADLDNNAIPFTYYDGILKASHSEDESSINITMNFGRSKTTGVVDLDFLSGQAKVKAALNLEK